MNVTEMLVARQRGNGRRLLPLLILAFTLITLTACSLLNRDDSSQQQVLGHKETIEGEGILVCSQACQEREQCGTITDRGKVILGGFIEPRVSAHDVYFPAQERVAINGIVPYTLRQVADGNTFSINFYNVTAASGKAGWVSGWCLAAP